MMGPCLPFWFLLAPAFFYSIPEFQPSLFYNKLFPTSGLLHVFLSLTHLGNSTHFGAGGGVSIFNVLKKGCLSSELQNDILSIRSMFACYLISIFLRTNLTSVPTRP